MIDTGRLKKIFEEKGMSQGKIAAHLGMSRNTFYKKMKKGVFDSDEIETMVQLLRIEKPIEIFFTINGT